MFDCYCLRPNSEPPPFRAAGPGENVPFGTFPNQGPPWWWPPMVAEFLHQLHVYRGQYAPYLHWYAVLLSATEMVLSLHALLSRAGWQHRLKWRPLWYIPEYLRINFALVLTLLTVHSCLLVIVGLQTGWPRLLWPYIGLHLATFVLESGYLMVDLLTAVSFNFHNHQEPPPTGRNGPGKWQSALMLALLGCNLSIVIAAYLNRGGPVAWSVFRSFADR